MHAYVIGPGFSKRRDGKNKLIFTQIFYTQRPNNKEITIKSCLVAVYASKAPLLSEGNIALDYAAFFEVSTNLTYFFITL